MSRFTTPGGTNLTGTIGGIVGGPAAAAGHIQPAVNSAYLFNGCVIGAPTCGTTPLNTGLTATLGAIEPLVALAPPTLTSVCRGSCSSRCRCSRRGRRS